MKTTKDYPKTSSLRRMGNALLKTALMLNIGLFALVLLSGKAFAQQPNKIQQAIDAIKASNHNIDDDYVTDGQRTVWVKSYKKWTPDDMAVIKKEAPDVLRFLGRAIQRQRYDVLEQLLPDYYREHGGVKAFAKDITKEQVVTPNSTGR